MKLAFFDDVKVGVVAGDSVVDVIDVVTRLGPQDVMRGVIERFDGLKGKLADACKVWMIHTYSFSRCEYARTPRRGGGA